MLIEEKGKVEYSTTRLSDCAMPDCCSRREYGVEMKEVTGRYLFGFIPLGEETRKKEYCPKHSSEPRIATNALRKEHEKAIKTWQEKKYQRQLDEFHDIVQMDLLPKFKYEGGMIFGPNEDRFEVYGNSYEEAKSFLLSSRVSVPLLLYSHGKKRITVLDPSQSVIVVDWTVSHDSNISADWFAEEFDDIEYVERDFYIVQTNELTGVPIHTPVHKLNNYVDEIVEWNEYISVKKPLSVNYCPACGDEYCRNINVSRAIIDGEEVLVTSHNERTCENIMGELNRDFIDREAYDMGHVECDEKHGQKDESEPTPETIEA